MEKAGMKAFWAALTVFALCAPTLGAPALAQPAGPAMLQRLLAQDANHDGAVTRAEAETARRNLFNALDRNGNGRLAGAEQPPLSQFMGGLSPSIADTDRDGSIARAEFMGLPYRVFDLFDANDDDTLDAGEIDAIRARAGQ